MSTVSGGPRIVIVGAGPAGLSTAYFLRKRGYQNVLVLEKLGRVGGLCLSMTCGNYSFDLGANYVTPAYKEVLRLAEEYGATMYAERPMIAMSVPEDPHQPATYQSMFDAVRFDDDTGKPIGVLRFLGLMVRYIWLRWRLAKVLDQPTFAGVETHPELAQPMQQWLDSHGLRGLTRLLQLPSTMMGYGLMSETPALYILKFMTLKTFVPMALKETPIIGNFTGWPKRFVNGFQRFWERISWDLQVRTNVNITRVERKQGEPIAVHFEVKAQELSSFEAQTGSILCDYLILACPQPVLLGTDAITGDGTGRYNPDRAFMELSVEERELFEQIREVWYCMTTFHVENLNFNGQSPLAPIYPLASILKPMGVGKQWDDCELVQFYSPISPYDVRRAIAETRKKVAAGDHQLEGYLRQLESVERHMRDPKDGEDPVRSVVIDNVRAVTRQMGGRIRDDNAAWHTYNRFTYFQHVGTEAILAGFYTKLERLQGQQRTFFVGGATNFELVEPIVEYARHLVARHFPPLS